LRYLSDVYRTLTQTVPEAFKTVETDELTEYFGAMLRTVDASLLDEWERIRTIAAPSAQATDAQSTDTNEAAVGTAAQPASLASDTRRFTVLVRNAVFAFMRALARGNYGEAVELLEGTDDAWNEERLEATLAPYWQEHDVIRTDAEARNPARMRIDTSRPGAWRVEQTLTDAEGECDWFLDFSIDLEASSALGRPALVLRHLGN
jgi:hypothetical protein